MVSARDIVNIVVSLVLIGVVMPIGIGLVAAFDQQTVAINGTSTLIGDIVDSNVLTLITVLIPVLAVVGIAMGYIPKMRG
jgi:hypothetical protein